MTTSSHINSEEDPMFTFSISHSWQFLITKVKIPLKWLGNLGVKGKTGSLDEMFMMKLLPAWVESQVVEQTDTLFTPFPLGLAFFLY